MLVFVLNLVFVGWCCLKLAPTLKAKVAVMFGTTTTVWGMCGMQRTLALPSVPSLLSMLCAVRGSTCALYSEADKDPSSLGPAERV